MSQKLARRLVVTGHDAKNKSKVALDTVVTGDPIPGQDGAECSVIWGADQKLHFPNNGAKPNYVDFFPPLDGFRLIETYLPARYAATADPSPQGEFAGEMDAVMPGLANAMSAERPGFHRTQSVDMIVVLEGRCVLQLDNEDVALNTGDMVIESGTIHGWVNPHDEPCRFLAAVVGAHNKLCE